MVSSDFGKLEVMRHLISGEDCAIAGEATAVAAAPAAETFKKSRRFIKSSPCRGVFPCGLKKALRHAIARIQPKALVLRFRSSHHLAAPPFANFGIEEH